MGMDIDQKKKDSPNSNWVKKIRKGDERAFEKLFFEYFYDLISFAIQITGSPSRSKDIVQEVYYKIWKRRDRWNVHTSIKAYLFRAVRNEALNFINRKNHRENTREELAFHSSKHSTHYSFEDTNSDQLLEQIWEIVSELPDRRKSVFILHRKHGLSYKEIAQVLDISRKTVENHMGHALDDIRAMMGQDNP